MSKATAAGYRGIWREPGEESIDLYPGLVVCDGRVTGSITTGQSRLPLWCFVYTAITRGWKEVEDGWSPTEHYGWDADKMGSFLYDLLEARGEFGRLLLVIANAERLEQDIREQSIEGQAPGESVVKISLGPDDDGVVLPPSWWEDPKLAAPVIEQLGRCLATLGASNSSSTNGRLDG